MKSDWAKWRRLDRSERWVPLQAMAILPLMAVGLRVLGYRRCVSLLQRLAPPRATPADSNPQDVSMADRTLLCARMVTAAASRGLLHASCLHRSLTLWWILRRRGIDSDLRIGVRKREDRFEAHAWVERFGQVLNDTADVQQRFSAFGAGVVPMREVSP